MTRWCRRDNSISIHRVSRYLTSINYYFSQNHISSWGDTLYISRVLTQGNLFSYGKPSYLPYIRKELWNSDEIYYRYRDPPEVICYRSSMSYFTYILRCADNTLYTGITTNLERRVFEHNHAERWAKYTKMRRPVELIYHEKHVSRSKACKREYVIKQLTKEEKERLISVTLRNEGSRV